MGDTPSGAFFFVMQASAFVTCYVLRPIGSGHEILQLLRRPGVYMGETWQPVSGAIEPGETATEAVLRELMEETQLAALSFFRLPSAYPFYIPQTDTLTHSICFCAIVDPQAEVNLNEEHTEFRWVDFSMAHEHFMWPSDHSAMREIEQFVLADALCSPHLRIH